MTNEERDLIARFISRVGGAPQSGGFLPGAASVPQSQPLPPIDREADQFITQQFQQYPEAPYRITQMAVVQEAALAESANRIRRLEWELEQTKHAMQQMPQQSPQQKGFFGSLFGGGQQQPQRGPGMGGPGYGGAPGYGGQAFQPTSAPPPPQYPPNYQPGMFQNRGGSGFLGSALTTAAGVAGGMVVGNALMNAFSGSHESGGGLFGGATTGASSPNAFDGGGFAPAGDPTAGFATGASDPWSGGGAAKDLDSGGGGGFTQDTSDPFGGGGGTYDPGSFDNSGGGGGFDSGSSFDGGGGSFDNSGSDNF